MEMSFSAWECHSVNGNNMSRQARKKRNASGKSKCDICGDIGFLEEHHIRGRKIKNANEPFNIADICPNCHFKVHLGERIKD